jgi:CubicO group peptidase (beta-lactamase class C family)
MSWRSTTGSVDAVQALRQVDRWPGENAAVALISADGTETAHGDLATPFNWASVTKLATALAALVAVEEGIVALDDPAGPPGSTLRHLLAHASGLPFEGSQPLAPPGSRRIYSNRGFEVAAEVVAAGAEMPFAGYFESLWGFPLGGSPAHGVEAPVARLVDVARELLSPRLVPRETLAEAASVQFPGLDGVLPGYGRYSPNDWGLGFELRDSKQPHWTGDGNSPSTFGHFGRAGGFLWVDPEAGVALACLTDHEFGDWSRDAWPKLADAVLASL